MSRLPSDLCFFFNDTATTEIYTLSLHDALPISRGQQRRFRVVVPCRNEDHEGRSAAARHSLRVRRAGTPHRSEEHTSELQSQFHLVCRLLLEKKKKKINTLSFCFIIFYFVCIYI